MMGGGLQYETNHRNACITGLSFGCGSRAGVCGRRGTDVFGGLSGRGAIRFAGPEQHGFLPPPLFCRRTDVLLHYPEQRRRLFHPEHTARRVCIPYHRAGRQRNCRRPRAGDGTGGCHLGGRCDGSSRRAVHPARRGCGLSDHLRRRRSFCISRFRRRSDSWKNRKGIPAERTVCDLPDVCRRPVYSTRCRHAGSAHAKKLSRHRHGAGGDHAVCLWRRMELAGYRRIQSGGFHRPAADMGRLFPKSNCKLFI